MGCSEVLVASGGGAETLGSALPAGILFLASPRKSSQKEGDPRVTRPASPAPLRYSQGRAAAQLGAAPLKQCSPTSPGLAPLLGAPRGGPGKPSERYRIWSKSKHKRQWRPIGVQLPLEDAEQRRLERGSGRGLSEGEARVPQPPLKASSGGNPAAGGASTRGRLFFGSFLLAEQKKGCPRVRRGTRQFSSLRIRKCSE